ncbi:MAG: hypothetical protein U9N49_11320 [Campylobacterota bacterium]|nr:hypothetical protein [Campylobacterota bacterium]
MKSLIALLNNVAGGTVGELLCCMGVKEPTELFFSELFALLVIVLLVKTSSIFVAWLSGLSDKIWRLGVLLGLAK